jgi:hypothetical protein
VLLSFSWKSGDPIKGTWFYKCIIPQNELSLLLNGADVEVFRYDEKVEINRVLNSGGKDLDTRGNEIEE